ncbi:MAG TPA: thioredoxin family protein [Puia sp.]|nr:thioredoxin family protein [Puia sp.]
MRHKLLLSAFFSVLFFQGIKAQDPDFVHFGFTQERINDQEVLLRIKAYVGKDAILYSIVKTFPDGPASAVTFDSSYRSLIKDSIVEKGNILSGKDTLFDNKPVRYVADSLEWQQKLILPKGKSGSIAGVISYMAKKGNDFKSEEKSFELPIKADIAMAGGDTRTASDPPKSLWFIFITGLVAGLGAFIMPCIYAMVPVTVSFFTKRSTSRQQGIRNAIYYSLSIIGIFTLLGFLITLIFGQGALNALASSAVFNVAVFLMFVIFGVSFLGAFEITLPSSWTNAIDSKASLSSFGGIFFMALTLVIVSFSCTVPFVGGLAVLATQGGKLAPLIGFFGFSLSLALPFALFAFFPTLLNQLGKSGGWLNAIKVSMGLIELALALKFLSSADLAYHWRLLDREIYLSLWIVLFGLLGLYLLGKIKFKHDSELPKNEDGVPYLTVTRTMFAIVALAFTVYMIPGLWGAPLKGISAWLPEMKTQDFNLSKVVVQSVPAGTDASADRPKKYTDFLESEIPGVDAFFDYDEAIAAARKAKKPLMIDFTGHSCANCRKMEKEVLSDAAVMSRLQKDFIVVSLYVDDKFRLPAEEWITSKNDGRQISSLGTKNLDFEVGLTNNSAQPLYVFVDNNGKIIQNAGGYNSDIQRFVSILEDVKTEFKKR